jgi:hypothetical protein
VFAWFIQFYGGIFSLTVIFGINAKNEENGRHFKTEGKK